MHFAVGTVGAAAAGAAAAEELARGDWFGAVDMAKGATLLYGIAAAGGAAFFGGLGYAAKSFYIRDCTRVG